MSKKDFIALADSIRAFPGRFSNEQIFMLAEFCKSRNPAFNRERWLSYIAGECGPNGGRK
jgi:hypothetical protein